MFRTYRGTLIQLFHWKEFDINECLYSILPTWPITPSMPHVSSPPCPTHVNQPIYTPYHLALYPWPVMPCLRPLAIILSKKLEKKGECIMKRGQLTTRALTSATLPSVPVLVVHWVVCGRSVTVPPSCPRPRPWRRNTAYTIMGSHWAICGFDSLFLFCSTNNNTKVYWEDNLALWTGTG